MLFLLLLPLFRDAVEKAWNNKGDIVAIEETQFQVRVFESAIRPGEYMFEFGEPTGGEDSLYDFGFAKSPEDILEHIEWLLS